uniref:Uncharacterized protein n=1 Tax=Arion vulgaris TaxID=1028688 RepID=A0A0B7A8M5_9EUPU
MDLCRHYRSSSEQLDLLLLLTKRLASNSRTSCLASHQTSKAQIVIKFAQIKRANYKAANNNKGN